MSKDDYKITMRDDFARAMYIVKDTKTEQRSKKKSGEKEECALLSKMEYSVLLSLMAKVNSYEDVAFNEYTFSKVEFLNEMNIKRNLTHQEVFELLERIGSYRFRMISKDKDGNDHITSYAFMPTVDLNCTKGIYKIKLHEDLMPFLLKKHPDNKVKKVNGKDEKPHFFTILIKHPLNLKSPYSIALYNFLKSYDFVKETSVKLDRLKNLFSYKKTKDFKFKDFRRDILDKSLKEINEKTDLNVSYNVEYKGRTVYMIKFAISKNEEGIIPDKPKVKRTKPNRTKKSKSVEAVENMDVNIDKNTAVEVASEDNLLAFEAVEVNDVEYSSVENNKTESLVNISDAKIKKAVNELVDVIGVEPPSKVVLKHMTTIYGNNIKLLMAIVYRASKLNGNLDENCLEIMDFLHNSDSNNSELELLMEYDSFLSENRKKLVRVNELSNKEDVKKIYDEYKSLIGDLTDKTINSINKAYETYFAYQIVGAIKKAAKSGGASFEYVKKILDKGACGTRKDNLFNKNKSKKVNNQTDCGFKNSGLTRQEIIERLDSTIANNTSDLVDSIDDEAFDFSILRE